MSSQISFHYRLSLLYPLQPSPPFPLSEINIFKCYLILIAPCTPAKNSKTLNKAPYLLFQHRDLYRFNKNLSSFLPGYNGIISYATKVLSRMCFLFFGFFFSWWMWGGERRREREKNIDHLPPIHWLGTEPKTWACVLVRNRTRDLSAHRVMLSQLGHTNQGQNVILGMMLT